MLHEAWYNQDLGHTRTDFRKYLSNIKFDFQEGNSKSGNSICWEEVYFALCENLFEQNLFNQEHFEEQKV